MAPTRSKKSFIKAVDAATPHKRNRETSKLNKQSKHCSEGDDASPPADKKHDKKPGLTKKGMAKVHRNRKDNAEDHELPRRSQSPAAYKEPFYSPEGY
jgi:hypothetical protein